jgi:protoporphyrinogen IX oxidase
MTYFIIKALHLLGVIFWMGGLLAVGSLLTASASASTDLRARFGSLGRSLYFSVNAPAMALALSCGIAMILMQPAGYLKSQPWLHSKLTLVAGIFIIDHMMMHRLRKLSQNTAEPSMLERAKWLLAAALTLGAVSVFLAVLRPWTA